MQDLKCHGKGFGHLPEGNRKPLRVISRMWQDLIRILEGHSCFQREYRLQETRRMWGDPVGGQAVVQWEDDSGSDGLERQ